MPCCPWYMAVLLLSLLSPLWGKYPGRDVRGYSIVFRFGEVRRNPYGG